MEHHRLPGKGTGHVLRCSVNGIALAVGLERDPQEVSLLEVLRGRLGLTAAKNGCAKGVCGACTVIMNGKAVRSCRVTAAAAAGAEIETLEHLSDPQSLHPLQYAFIVEGAVQCGFCTPGMIMAAKALLDGNPDPDREAVRRALQPNLCRCTGFQPIHRAVEFAAGLLREGNGRIALAELELVPAGPAGGVIGGSVRDAEVVRKVTGRLEFADDRIHEADTLHGKMVYSSRPCGTFTLDISAAAAMPGVALVLTADDIPGRNELGMIVPDQPVFAPGRSICVADPVAAVFAGSAEEAAEAAAAIVISYDSEEDGGIYTPEEALEEGAARIHAKGNICHTASLKRGDTAAAFLRAAAEAGDTFRTQAVDPGFMEPESGRAWVDSEGRVVVEMGTQSAFDDRRQLAVVLGLPEERIIVRQLPTGGAFGAKEDITLQAVLALAALKSGKRVRMTLTREESFRVHPKRHPVTVRCRMAADSKGRFLAFEADIVADTGAYASLGPDILENMLTFGAGPYEVPALAVTGTLVYTNNPPSGAVRGFGVPQAAFAVEQLVDRLAEKLGMSPLEIRRINALAPGRYLASGHRMEEGTAMVQTLAALEEAMRGERKPPDTEEFSYGIGYAAAMKNVGFGHGSDEQAGAFLEIETDGVLLRCGTFEYGQGSLTVLRQLAAEALGAAVTDVRLALTETEHSPETGATTASRQTFLSGNAVVQAASALQELVRERAAGRYGGEAQQWQVVSSRVSCAELGIDLPLSDGLFAGLSAQRRYQAPPTEGFVSGEVPFARRSSVTHWSYSYTAQAALVQVHRASGSVKVVKIWAAVDCGRALNPLNVRSQITGGVVQGMGFALSERVVTERGRVKSDNFDSYRMPRSMQIPEIIPVIVEVPDPRGPFGAKGMGEVPILAAAPAIVHAAHAATGAWITALPIA
jgi:aldehyde oxidoreductase